MITGTTLQSGNIKSSDRQFNSCIQRLYDISKYREGYDLYKGQIISPVAIINTHRIIKKYYTHIITMYPTNYGGITIKFRVRPYKHIDIEVAYNSFCRIHMYDSGFPEPKYPKHPISIKRMIKVLRYLINTYEHRFDTGKFLPN